MLFAAAAVLAQRSSAFVIDAQTTDFSLLIGIELILTYPLLLLPAI